jgi:Na+/melibiose symporter-like transporter
MSTAKLTGWCTPSIVHAGLSGIGLIVLIVEMSRPYNKYEERARDERGRPGFFELVTSVVIAILFGMLLYWLCRSGRRTAAWAILLAKMILVPAVWFVWWFLIAKPKEWEEKRQKERAQKQKAQKEKAQKEEAKKEKAQKEEAKKEKVKKEAD